MFHPPCRSLCVCVCVCPAVSCPVSVTPGGLHGAGQVLPNLPVRVLPGSGSCAQPDPCSSFNSCFPQSVWGWFCLFFLLSPCRSGCCTQTCERGAAGEGNWFVLALDRTSACIQFLSDLSLMALEQTGNAHPHTILLTALPQEATRVPSELRSQSEFCFSSRMSVPEVVPSAASVTTCTWKQQADCPNCGILRDRRARRNKVHNSSSALSRGICPVEQSRTPAAAVLDVRASSGSGSE